MRRIAHLLLFPACVFAAGADFPPFPEDAFGVWGGLPGTAGGQSLSRGTSPTITWKSVEPRNGQYNFAGKLGDELARAAASGLYIYIKLWVGEDSPAWIYGAGVPKAEVPPHINPLGRKVQHVYPYYFSAKYQEYFHRLIRAFGDYIHGLPRPILERIAFVQICEGSTGDGQPYKSIPINPEYRITREQWSDFRIKTWQIYADAFQKNRVHPVRLLVNGDANREKENAWLIEHWKQIGVKQGMFSHGYVVSGATDRAEEYRAFKARAESRGAFVFSRGEQDAEWKTYGWSTQNPDQAFYWSALFALQSGLDTWQVPADAMARPGIVPAVALFNRYAGRYDAARSPGAFCALARGLDVSDVQAYPESEFGEARKNNRERYRAIVRAFADRGARVGDVDKAMGHGMVNRKAQDHNDAGWQIWPGNYERFLRQIDPENTSTAWWHLPPAASIYSRFARAFDAKGGKTAMYFDLDDGFFPAARKTRTADIRVVYLDRSDGTWRLNYHATGGVKNAATVANKNTGEWQEVTVAVGDGAFANGGARQSDLVLEHVSGGDVVFHLVEVTRR